MNNVPMTLPELAIAEQKHINPPPPGGGDAAPPGIKMTIILEAIPINACSKV